MLLNSKYYCISLKFVELFEIYVIIVRTFFQLLNIYKLECFIKEKKLENSCRMGWDMKVYVMMNLQSKFQSDW